MEFIFNLKLMLKNISLIEYSNTHLFAIVLSLLNFIHNYLHQNAKFPERFGAKTLTSIYVYIYISVYHHEKYDSTFLFKHQNRKEIHIYLWIYDDTYYNVVTFIYQGIIIDLNMISRIKYKIV